MDAILCELISYLRGYLLGQNEENGFLLTNVAEAHRYGVITHIIATDVEDPCELINHRNDSCICSLPLESVTNLLDALGRCATSVLFGMEEKRFVGD